MPITLLLAHPDFKTQRQLCILSLCNTNSKYLFEFIENQGWVSRKFHFFSTDKREHTAAICHMCQKLSFLHVSTIHISQWTVLCMYFTTSTLELNGNFNVFCNNSIHLVPAEGLKIGGGMHLVIKGLRLYPFFPNIYGATATPSPAPVPPAPIYLYVVCTYVQLY